MKLSDGLKAFGLGVLVMALNLALVFALGFIHDTLIEPGRTPAYYQTVYPKIGAWSAPIGAMVLLFLIAWRFGVRRPERNAYLFAGAVYASYFGVDVALGLAMGPLSNLLVPPFLIAVVGGAAASLAGAYCSQRRAA
jgi:hypothetical protein